MAYYKEQKISYRTKKPLSSENSILSYFDNDELATTVYRDKYENSRQSITETSTPSDMHKQIADSIANIENNYKAGALKSKEIYALLHKFKYLVPGGSVMYALNHPTTPVSLSNCWVIGSETEKDSYGTIMMRDEELIQLSKRRGGVGIDLSYLRSKGSKVNNSAKYSTGILPFAERYSNSIKEVAQDGRRGALLLSLNFVHPDIIDFINAKANTNKLTGANISVKITDKQMLAIVKNLAGVSKKNKYAWHDWVEDQAQPADGNEVHAPVAEMNNPPHLVFDQDGNMVAEEPQQMVDNEFHAQVVGEQEIGWQLNAPSIQKDTDYGELSDEALFTLLATNARDFAEPGILFWSRIRNQIDGLDCYKDFHPVTVNPCGELPLSPYESCRLLAQNLYNYVINPFTSDAEFDYDLWELHAEIAQRMLDDIIDIELNKINVILDKLNTEKIVDAKRRHPDTTSTEINLWTEAYRKASNGRRTGLGYTALADAIAALGMRYGSLEAQIFSADVSMHQMRGSYRSSINLAKERGHFPAWSSTELTADNEFIRTIKRLFHDEPEVIEMWTKHGRRNIQNMAIAPTGSISILTKSSSGIEPVFSLRYTRRRRVILDKGMKTSNIIIDDNGDAWEEFKVVHQKLQLWYEVVYKDKKDLAKLSEKEFKEIIKLSPYYGCTAHDVDPIEKIDMQAAIQQFVDHSISNTLNLKENVTSDEVLNYLLYAWEAGLKGISVYRDGSRGGILLKEDKKKEFSERDAIKRPKVLGVEIHEPVINKQPWVVIVGILKGKPYEVFAFKNKENMKFKKNASYILVKVGKGHYRLEEPLVALYGIPTTGTSTVIENVINYFEKPNEEFITRLISTSLRHGTNVKFVTEQITKSEGVITDFSKIIARVLNKYAASEMSRNDKCPDCGNSLQFTGGCLSCSCGYSKC